MIGFPGSSGARTLRVLLMGAFFLHLSTPTHSDSPHRPAAPGFVQLGGEDRREEGQGSFQEEDEEREDELFKDVDPKTLAAVLLEALNRSQTEREREGEEEDKKESRGVRRIEGAEGERDGRQALELLMAAQDKEREREEEEEKRKAQQEEEKLTEKVKSRTTSQTVEVKPEEKKGEAHSEKEEQLSPEELRSLETVMKEFPSLSKASRRTSRGYSAYNDVLKGEDTVMKKKLKWQEETQKAVNFPTFRGGNFMDEFEDAARPEEYQADEDGPKEEEDVEVLSPEEEEAQAKAEQEELSRQAAEAQRAKVEEEKLADIASDMLLRYMGNANKKYTSSLSNAAEDKRSDEVEEEDDDIDPQTIDKLIEISSKLHLPADDVVDIINDVEKKKKKDVPPEIPAPQIPTNQNSFLVSKQPSAAMNLLKAWFQDTPPSRSQDVWVKPAKPLSANHDVWPKLQKEIKPNMWLKPPPSVWSRYSPYFTYPSSYPVYLPPPPRPKPRYYIPQPPLTLHTLLGGSRRDAYNFPPKHRFRNWIQPRLRPPPTTILHQRPYYSQYPLPVHPHGLRPFPISKPRSPPRMVQTPPPQSSFYYSAVPPRGYYGGVMGKQREEKEQEDLERFIKQILTKRPPMLKD